jgi:D-alanyl-D-alanine carboxypeptidase/D-alanyl-D-alanine-endopeptidase (penicillin-binding protein 4)
MRACDPINGGATLPNFDCFRGVRAATLAALLATAALWAPATGQARGPGPDRAFRTPVAHGSAAAHTAVSSSRVSVGLSKLFRRVGKSGAYAIDAATGQVLFARKPGRPRILASNTKVFTTSTALARFEPQTRLETTVLSSDDISDGISQGLYLRGAGDPTLNGNGLEKLANRVRAAGVLTVQGPLFYDDSFLDQRTTIPQHGISKERIGSLSALTIDAGAPSDPARTTAQRFDDALRKAGVGIGNSVAQSVAPHAPPPQQVAELGSPTMAELIRSTNVPSNNFLAEMLLKDVGGMFGDSGSTAAGVAVVQRFASENGASLKAENGSGLSRRNRSSPASVVNLLDGMIQVDDKGSPEKQLDQMKLRDAFVDSLAVAGRSGTLARRMRHTAAQGRCRAKTGTLNRVSALSGYCFRGAEDQDHAVVFSLLMNGVDVNRAHLVQDRMAALLARYNL